MSKAAVRPQTTTSEADVERRLAVALARKQFVGAAMNMGWQLALSVIVPVIIGVKLDDHFHTAPSYTLAALFLAIGGVVVIISNTIKQVNKEQTVRGKGKKSA